MGNVYADIELINGEDFILARKSQMDKDEMKSMNVNMMVDSGCCMMAINETIQEVLQLPCHDTERIQLADGKIVDLNVVGPIEVRFANRRASCDAYVLPGNAEPLLGNIPMEQMDVLIHPLRQELIVNPKHPEGAVHRL
ncbi:MAG TPA: retropepsin-like aspartic protease [Chitinophagaceae bacterium]|nr:retropepsin-like aspartic protease [Chitinophagaceae bacterium]